MTHTYLSDWLCILFTPQLCRYLCSQETSKRKGCCIFCGLDLLCMLLICGPEPVTYAGLTETGQYLLSDVAEVVYVTARNPGFCCGIGNCSESYDGTLRIFFNKFDAANMAPTTLKTSSASAFETFANTLFNNGLYLGDGSAGVDYIEITSTKESDAVFDYENPKSIDAFQNLASIYTTLNELVVQGRPQSPWTAPSSTTASKLLSADTVNADWASLDTVDEGKVKLPMPWAALAPSESVVAAQTNMYVMTCMDWLKSCCSCGYYYCCTLSEKRQIRPSIILTSHRLLEVTPAVDDGCTSLFTSCLPTCLTGCFCPVVRGMVVRSLYPRHIFSGILTREMTVLSMGVCTDMGAFYLTFDQLPGGSAVDMLKSDSRLAKKLAFCHALMSASSRAVEFETGENEKLEPTKDELNIFPFGEGEEPLARYNGSVPDDMCDPLCTKKQTWHPGCCLVCTCGVKPMFSEGVVTITNTSVYSFKQRANKPWGCWCCLTSLVKKYDWQLLWTPLSHLISSNVETLVVGDDSCKTRCCKSNFIGQNCCPVTKSAMTISIKTKNNPMGDGTLMGIVGNLSLFKTLREEPALKAFREALARVQGNLRRVNPSKTTINAVAHAVGAPKSMAMDDDGSRM